MIITQYAEDKLVDFARRATANPTRWQALHCSFDKLEGAYNDPARLQITVNLLKDKLPEEDVQIYFCRDGDIFIAAYGADESIFKNLKTHIHTVFPDVSSNCRIFKMVDEHDIFSDLTNIKLEEEKKRRHEEEMQDKKNEESRDVRVDEAYAKDMLVKRAQRTGMHILVVEDDAFTLKLVSGVLDDYTVIKAMDGIDAVESYMLNAPDMVFLDINIPSLSGHEVLKKIKAFDPNAHVVMLSGNRSMTDVSNALAEGAKGFVAKPFPKEKLLNCVRICQSSKESAGV